MRLGFQKLQNKYTSIVLHQRVHERKSMSIGVKGLNIGKHARVITANIF